MLQGKLGDTCTCCPGNLGLFDADTDRVGANGKLQRGFNEKYSRFNRIVINQPII